MPEEFQTLGATWLTHNPGWEMRTWDETTMPVLRNQALYDAAPNYAQKADIARYELLHQLGGIYLDTDFECFKPIDELLVGVTAFAGTEDNQRVSNSIIGGTPGHGYFEDLIQALPPSHEENPGADPDVVTGPVLATRVLRARQQAGHDDVTIFAPELFYPYHWTEKHRRHDIFPDAYAAHHWCGSWLDEDTRAAHAAIQQQPAPTAAGAASVGSVGSVGSAGSAGSENTVKVALTLDTTDLATARTVLSTALIAFNANDPVELVLCGAGVEDPGEELGMALQELCSELSPVGHALPDIVLLGESEAAAVDTVLRVQATGDSRADAQSVLMLSATAQALWQPGQPAQGPTPPPATAPIQAAPTRPTPVFVGNDRVLLEPEWGGKLYCSASDMSVSPELILRGVFDRPLCIFLQQNLRPGGVCFDVGANIGAVTLLMATLVGATGEVHAYEVSPTPLALLRDNISLNYYNDFVTVHDQAAWSHEDSLTFHVSERFQGNGSLFEHNEWYENHFQVDTFSEQTVRAVPLGPALAEHAHVDLVKIDVEGAELRVLQGMSAALSAGHVDTVVLEVVKNRMEEGWDDFSALLRKFSGEGWLFSTLAGAGVEIPLDVEQVLGIGWFDSVILRRPRA